MGLPVDLPINIVQNWGGGGSVGREQLDQGRGQKMRITLNLAAFAWF